MKPRLPCLLSCSLLAFILSACSPSAPSVSLHQAVQKGDVKTVQRHILAKSDLNKKDLLGMTPLHLAAMKGDLAMVKVLTEAGADVSRKGQGDKTPIDVAREKRQTAVVQYLEAHAPAANDNSGRSSGGRGLIDGGLGVSGVLDSQ